MRYYMLPYPIIWYTLTQHDLTWPRIQSVFTSPSGQVSHIRLTHIWWYNETTDICVLYIEWLVNPFNPFTRSTGAGINILTTISVPAPCRTGITVWFVCGTVLRVVCNRQEKCLTQTRPFSNVGLILGQHLVSQNRAPTTHAPSLSVFIGSMQWMLLDL